MRHPRILEADKAILLVIDVQEKFKNHIFEFSDLCKNIVTLIKAADILNVPVVVTEQYPKGLGATVDEIKTHLTKYETFEKDCFSSFAVKELADWLENSGRKQVIVCGIETHVCVSQTAHDLMFNGYDVHLVCDAVSSRFEKNKEIGIKKVVTAGGVPTCVEAALFEMLVASGTDTFKEVQKLVK